MFLWSGCICLILWAIAILKTNPAFGRSDFAPFFIYLALAAAGVFLISSDPKRSRHSEIGAPESGWGLSGDDKSCRVMTIGPLDPIQNVLLQLDQAVLIGAAQTAAGALQQLASFAASEIPHLLIMPAWLPVVSSSVLIRAIKSDPTLNPIHIIVWGGSLPLPETQALYDAGATCVISIPCGEKVIRALRQFCLRF